MNQRRKLRLNLPKQQIRLKSPSIVIMLSQCVETRCVPLTVLSSMVSDAKAINDEVPLPV